jgi:hypothetical protein
MDDSVFISKFQNLPEGLKQPVLEFIDFLLSRYKPDDNETNLPEPSTSPDSDSPIEWIEHNGKMLPITPASENADLKALSGIWADQDISLESLRHAAINAPATGQGEVSEAIPVSGTTKAAHIQALLGYVETADLPNTNKIIAPSHEERNER